MFFPLSALQKLLLTSCCIHPHWKQNFMHASHFTGVPISQMVQQKLVLRTALLNKNMCHRLTSRVAQHTPLYLQLPGEARSSGRDVVISLQTNSPEHILIMSLVMGTIMKDTLQKVCICQGIWTCLSPAVQLTLFHRIVLNCWPQILKQVSDDLEILLETGHSFFCNMSSFSSNIAN